MEPFSFIHLQLRMIHPEPVKELQETSVSKSFTGCHFVPINLFLTMYKTTLILSTISTSTGFQKSKVYSPKRYKNIITSLLQASTVYNPTANDQKDAAPNHHPPPRSKRQHSRHPRQPKNPHLPNLHHPLLKAHLGSLRLRCRLLHPRLQRYSH